MKDNALKTALWLCLAAMLGCALIFPEVILQHTTSFLTWGDYLVDYESTFVLTGFFYQGGIELWDFFGQLPHAFFWMTLGMFKLPNLLCSIAYVLLSPFSDIPPYFSIRYFPSSTLVPYCASGPSVFFFY